MVTNKHISGTPQGLTVVRAGLHSPLAEESVQGIDSAGAHLALALQQLEVGPAEVDGGRQHFAPGEAEAVLLLDDVRHLRESGAAGEGAPLEKGPDLLGGREELQGPGADAPRQVLVVVLQDPGRDHAERT